MTEQSQLETATLEDAPESQELSEFKTLLAKKFRNDKVYDDEKAKKYQNNRKNEVEQAVSTLARFLIKKDDLELKEKESDQISFGIVKTIELLIKNIDKLLTDQVNLILHHDEFQKLESAWRGLDYLVRNTETDEQLKIKVLNVSQDDLRKGLRKFEGTAWDQSPFFKKIYEEEFGQLGGEPYGCLVGDYYFSHSPVDVKLLEQISKVAASAHCPFIAGASPAIMQIESWSELANPRDLTKIFSTVEYAPWHSLRESDDSKYIGLAMPRFLARPPYGAKTNPVDGFHFEEFDSRLDDDSDSLDSPEVKQAKQKDKDAKRAKMAKYAADGKNYVWANSAYAMAVNINRSFKLYGWCSKIRGIESGGAVRGLPVHTFPTDDGGQDMKCPTEIAISDRRDGELAKNGFMPLMHQKNSDFAAFIGAQSLYKPKEHHDPNATANENLSARLPYLFATGRFAHYLKSMVRSWVGKAMERKDMEVKLNEWINNYVDPDPANSGEEYQASHPLSEARVEVEEDVENPGYYKSKFFLRPHYQLEGLTVSLRLVSKLPSAKGA